MPIAFASRSRGIVAAAVILLASSISCGLDPVEADLPAVSEPEVLDDGWETGKLEENGFDATRIELLLEEIRHGDLEEIHTLLIARHGRLLVEEYPGPNNGRDVLHVTNSVTKSVIAMLVGIAIREGWLDGTDRSIADFLPEYSEVFDADPQKREITLRHLLTMTDGFSWDDKQPSDPTADGRVMRLDEDPVRYILERPVASEPGSRFHYTSAPVLVAGALRHLTGMDADVYARQVLFEPLGIHQSQWGHLKHGFLDADGGLYLRARDLARLGQLVLQKGQWDGQEIIPEWFISESVRWWVHSDQDQTGYGYYWWLSPLPLESGGLAPAGIIQASGYGGQKLIIVPEYDLVVVFFGCQGTYECGLSDSIPNLALYNYILPALR